VTLQAELQKQYSNRCKWNEAA